MVDFAGFAAQTLTGPPMTGAAQASSTLLDGTTFCISGPNGDIEPGGVHGLFVLGTTGAT